MLEHRPGLYILYTSCLIVVLDIVLILVMFRELTQHCAVFFELSQIMKPIYHIIYMRNNGVCNKDLKYVH